LLEVAPQPAQIRIAQTLGPEDIVGRAPLEAQAILPGLLPHRRPRQHLQREDIVWPQVLAPDEIKRLRDPGLVVVRQPKDDIQIDLDPVCVEPARARRPLSEIGAPQAGLQRDLVRSLEAHL